jgi:hypothetical protein
MNERGKKRQVMKGRRKEIEREKERKGRRDRRGGGGCQINMYVSTGDRE